MPDIEQYRVVIERPLGPRESRVCREERIIKAEDASRLAAYWREHSGRSGVRGWVERRTVSLWEDFRA
jgi:hypothetical protein